ncbi:MAG: PD40 domain-containing protein [Candidatus Aminicenantes bacterium]|nr:PD40 domain-containing protein [Candidatus Aminicenantes bacterium]
MKKGRKKFCYSVIYLISFFLFFIAASRWSSADGPLLRFPDIFEDTIVFVQGEDIWTVPATGGVAHRITLHDGEERFPKFSPDGKMIAFTGEYDGNGDVYVMNIHGGDITRVTFHPGYDEVVGWHPVKNKILFRSSRNSFSRFDRLFLVSPDGTGLEELILHEAAQGSFSPDGKKIAYNRGAREHRTWKRYKGGTAQEVYIFDFETNSDKKMTQFRGTDRIPMWIGDKIYFSSDRDGVLNLYSFNTATEEILQVTRHKEYDVRRPSMGGTKIVYEVGGALWCLDTKTGDTKEVSIQVLSDAPEARPYLKKVDDYITGFDISPHGKRALVEARGEVFTLPENEGPVRNLTGTSGARDKDPAWSPDGKTVAFLSDKSGEYEIYLKDPMGRENSIRLTQHDKGYRHTLRWSPDSKKIAFADQTLRCYVLDVGTRKITEVDKAHYENVDVSLDLKPIYDFRWSPDSCYLAYSKMDADLVVKVYIYSLDTGDIHCVSSGIFNDFGPVFSKDGEHLFFISNRRFDPTFCDFEWEMVYKEAAGICCLTLKKDGRPLLPFLSDEHQTAQEEKHQKEKGKSGEEKRIHIDFDGLSKRIEMLPLSRGNFRSLDVNEDSLFYLNAGEGDYNRFEFREKGPRRLCAFDIKDKKERIIIEGVNGYRLSADGSKIIYRKGGSLGIISAGAKDGKGKALDLSGLKMMLNPSEEWMQIFHDAWRMERDFYYEPNMHGIDWPAMREKYGRLISRASCRQDVQYIIGELIGELNTSHTYVFGGDIQRHARRVNVGMLGVDWEEDAVNNRYRFKKIYKVADWTRGIVPPLTKPGININEGDYLLQVNGMDVKTDKNIYSYFLDSAGKQVSLLVNSGPAMQGAHLVTVKPLSDESTLKYLDWVEHNRMLAEEKSGGKIGYIHLPDTYLGSAREFPKYFYSQLRKKGLIIDGRFNGGGLDPDIFLRRLDKDLHAYWTRRYSHDQTIPDFVTTAHMVCLTNRQAGSGGDMLPMEFQMKRMGPVIGTRTWGGLVGVSMWISMIDGGGLSAPDYRIYNREGEWIVENEGVTPDIEIDLDPAGMARGIDAQLMKGIEVLLKKIEEDPRPWPKHKPYKIDK